MAQGLCPSCDGKGEVGNFVCGLCGGTGFPPEQEGPGIRKKGDNRQLPPVEGVLKIVGWVLVAGVLYATYLAYQNAPGTTSDKAFSASITFGVLGFLLIVLMRALQFFFVVAGAIIIGAVIDHTVNEGGVSRSVLATAGPLAQSLSEWLSGMISGSY